MNCEGIFQFFFSFPKSEIALGYGYAKSIFSVLNPFTFMVLCFIEGYPYRRRSVRGMVSLPEHSACLILVFEMLAYT